MAVGEYTNCIRELKMPYNGSSRQQVMLLLLLAGFVLAVQEEEITLLEPKQVSTSTRVLSFPADQCMGNLYVEPEGLAWHPKYVSLQNVDEWDYVAAAQGQVRAPAGKRLQLNVLLTLTPAENARFRRQNQHAYQFTIADRIRQDPHDLSGLLTLDPNDLSWLYVGTELYRRMNTPAQVFEPIGHLTGLEILTLYSSGITGEGLACLKPLRSLKGLALTQFGLGNQDLAILKKLPILEYLELNTGLTDIGLKQVAKIPNLRWLRIIDGRIWGAGLVELKNIPHLERLCFQQSRHPLTDRHVKQLEGLTKLKGLTFWAKGGDVLTDASLASIGKLKNLEELYFIRTSPNFTVQGLTHLQTLTELKVLELPDTWAYSAGTNIGDQLAKQVAGLPNLESLSGLSYLSNEGMKSLTALTKLRKLHVFLKDIKQGYTGPTGLSHLAELSNLEELSIVCYENTLSARDFDSLEPLHSLKALNLPFVDERSLVAIGRLKQLEHLSVRLNSPSGVNHLNGLTNLQSLRVAVLAKGTEKSLSNELLLDLSSLKKLKGLALTIPSLHDSDLAFLAHLPLLEDVMIDTSSSSALTGEVLHYFHDLPKLDQLYIRELSHCTNAHAVYLNGLKKTRRITLQGDIDNAFIKSMTGPLSLESLNINTNRPISQQTVDDFVKRHPAIEFIRIREPVTYPTVQTAPLQNTRIRKQQISTRDRHQRR